MTRRHFLRAGGGFALALPFLPSLLPRGAQAQASARDKRFVSFFTTHGGVWPRHMHPPADWLTERRSFVPGHDVLGGALRREVVGSDARISDVLTAASGDLTDAMVSKMNVLTGFHVPWYMSHHLEGFLGNFVKGSSTEVVPDFPQSPTIDQLMAWSPSFYTPADLGVVQQRVMIPRQPGPGNATTSFTYSDPESQSGPIQQVGHQGIDRLRFFRAVFGDVQPATQTQEPPRLVVDRVIDDYRRLRDRDRRLSSGDRQRLEDHMQRLFELERRLTASVGASCGQIQPPQFAEGEDARTLDFEDSLEVNDILATALICGVSRIASVLLAESYLPAYAASAWHDIAHAAATDSSRQTIIVDHMRRCFQVVLDLAKKLDVDDGSGTTVLDQTLIMWGHESGIETHHAINFPIVTFGSAGGALRTGQYCDYRNQTPDTIGKARLSADGVNRGYPEYTGCLYHQWLANVLMALDIPETEWARTSNAGYGHLDVIDNYNGAHVPATLSGASEWLPFLRA
jgi:hypothetical protein